MPIFEINTNAVLTEEQTKNVIEGVCDVLETKWKKPRHHATVQINHKISHMGGNQEPNAFIKIHAAEKIPREVCDGVAELLVKEKVCVKPRVFIIKNEITFDDVAFYFPMEKKEKE